MKLLMISGDRSVLQGKKGAFFYTLEELSKHFERVDVITPKVPSAKCQVPSVPSNVHFHSSSHGLFHQPFWILSQGKKLLAEHHHEVMTVHEYPPFYNGLGAMLLNRATHIPYMLEIHHIVGWPRAASLQELIGRWISFLWLRFSAKHAKVVRVVSNDVQEKLPKIGIPKDKIEQIVSFYLDHTLLQPDPSIQKKYDCVFAARLVLNKGLANVLHAVALLPNVSLLVIGDGPERKRSEALTKELGIASRVNFVGWLPDNESVYRAI